MSVAYGNNEDFSRLSKQPYLRFSVFKKSYTISTLYAIITLYKLQAFFMGKRDYKQRGQFAKTLKNFKDLDYQERLIIIQALEEKAKREYDDENMELVVNINDIIRKLHYYAN